jgi:Fe(3+) dicitrate transport protein
MRETTRTEASFWANRATHFALAALGALGVMSLVSPSLARADAPATPASQAVAPDAAATTASQAVENAPDDSAEGEYSLTVRGAAGMVARADGSSAQVTRAQLNEIRPVDGNEALRTLPGVRVVDEDGFGLRLNISIRGQDPDRGRSTAVLEDGVPVSMAPYGQPDVYYVPPIDRMDRLELIKGADQVLYGPQTVGATLNYVTPDPPEKLRIKSELRYGRFGYLTAFASVGDTYGNAGWLVQAFHTRYDGPRGLNARQTDVLAKGRLQTGRHAFLTLKLNVYQQDSNATHVGLTTPQFNADPTISLALLDNFPVRRYAATLQHVWRADKEVLGGVRWVNTLYGHVLSRDWNRQDFQRTDPEKDDLDPKGKPWLAIYGSNGQRYGSVKSLPAGDLENSAAILMQNSVGMRRRSFRVAGYESRVFWDYPIGDIATGELTAAARVHVEEIRATYQNGTTATSLSGTDRDDALLSGLAVSGVVQNRFTLWKRLRLTPAFRYDAYWQRRAQYSVTTAGVFTSYADPVTASDYSPGIIPAMTVAYNFIPELTGFAGVHKGWAPPRVEDSVTNAGTSLNLGPRSSWNYELGLRSRVGDWLNAELTGFYNDFQRQVISPSESAGIVNVDPLNSQVGGPAKYAGLDVGAVFDSAALARWGFSLPLTVSYTWLPLAEFGPGWQPDYTGNRIHYTPKHSGNVRLAFAHPFGFSGSVTGQFVGEQFADPENTVAASLNGLRGVVPAYATVDATLAYLIKPAGLEIFVSGKNLTNQVYIASRRPQGIMPMGFATYVIGLRGQWDL